MPLKPTPGLAVRAAASGGPPSALRRGAGLAAGLAASAAAGSPASNEVQKLRTGLATAAGTSAQARTSAMACFGLAPAPSRRAPHFADIPAPVAPDGDRLRFALRRPANAPAFRI